MNFLDEMNEGKSGQPVYSELRFRRRPDGTSIIDGIRTLEWDRSLRKSYEFVSFRAAKKRGEICSVCHSEIDYHGCSCRINDMTENNYVYCPMRGQIHKPTKVEMYAAVADMYKKKDALRAWCLKQR